MTLHLNSYRNNYYIVNLLLIMTILSACSYSHKKVDYPVDFKYASISIEYSGVSDSLKSVVADSIFASISRAGLIITPVDTLKGDSLLIVNAYVINREPVLELRWNFIHKAATNLLKYIFQT